MKAAGFSLLSFQALEVKYISKTYNTSHRSSKCSDMLSHCILSQGVERAYQRGRISQLYILQCYTYTRYIVYAAKSRAPADRFIFPRIFHVKISL